MIEGEEIFMRRALELASLGLGTTSPNPQVGAVLVHDGKIIGEGYHRHSGEGHAEVLAVASVKERHLLPKSTLYVTLEPCAHYGKTPPCVELILKERIPRVIVAMEDPFPAVSGRGIQRLREEGGVEVLVGMLEEEARRLNAPFITAHTLHRPYVTLKWAQSLDGYIDRVRSNRSERPELFSSPLQQRLVHRERFAHDAILVGYRTALLDDPLLNNRLWWGRSPLRVILDPYLELPHDLRIFSDRTAPTLILYLASETRGRLPQQCPSHLRYLPLTGQRIHPQAILSTLHQEGVQSLLVEGGSTTLARFLEAELYDNLLIEVCPRTLGKGIPAPHLPQPR